jgi:hypothetical protein
VILQFKTSYLLSEISDTVRNKMATAIANVIGRDSKDIALSFSETDIQGRRLLVQKGVLVDVILLNFKGSPDVFASNLTESNINSQMVSMGLKPVQVMAQKSEQTNGSGTFTSKPSTTSSELSVGGIIGVVIAGVFVVSAAGGAYILLQKKKQNIVSHIFSRMNGKLP